MHRIAPSARLEAQIGELLTRGVSDDRERLGELGRLGARLVLQRAVEEEVAAFLGRARYERTSTATGSRFDLHLAVAIEDGQHSRHEAGVDVPLDQVSQPRQPFRREPTSSHLSPPHLVRSRVTCCPTTTRSARTCGRNPVPVALFIGKSARVVSLAPQSVSDRWNAGSSTTQRGSP